MERPTAFAYFIIWFSIGACFVIIVWQGLQMYVRRRHAKKARKAFLKSYESALAAVKKAKKFAADPREGMVVDREEIEQLLNHFTLQQYVADPKLREQVNSLLKDIASLRPSEQTTRGQSNESAAGESTNTP